MSDASRSAGSAEWTGRLEGISPAELLWEICSRGRTGVLRVVREPVTRELYIQDGRVVFVTSSDPDDRLGERLLRQRKVTLEQLESALTRLRTGKRLGTLLVENDALTPDELVTAVVCQVRSIVLAVLRWESGHYVFLEGPLPSQEVITLQMRTPALLLHGLRNRRSVTRVLRRVGPPRTAYRMRDRRATLLADLAPTEGERLLLQRLEAGPATVETLCGELLVSGWEVYQAIDSLTLLGVIERAEAPLGESPDEAHEGRLNQKSLPVLLVELQAAAASGVLQLHRDGVERRLHFTDGRCSFATSNDPDDGLVNSLFRSGMIALADKEEVTRRLLSERRVGMILRDLGVLDDEDLRGAVRTQVREIVLDSFTWADGEYVFVPGAPGTEPQELTPRLTLHELIVEGVRRIECWTRLVRGCGGIDNPQRRSAGHEALIESFEPESEERRIAEMMATTRTPRRVCAMSDVDDFRVCQILWTLRLLGTVEDAPAELEMDDDEITSEEEVALGVSGMPVLGESPVAAEPSTAEQVQAALRELPERYNAGMAPDWNIPGSEGDEKNLEAAVVNEEWGKPLADDSAASAMPADESPAPEHHDDDGGARIQHVVRGGASATPFAARSDTLHEEEPDWPGPDDLDDVVERFNAMHRIVFRAVRGEVGAGAINFVRSCCGRIGRHCEDALEGVELHADGSWDAEGLKHIVCLRHIEDPWAIYQQILDQLYLELTPHLGAARADALKERILAQQPAPTDGDQSSV